MSCLQLNQIYLFKSILQIKNDLQDRADSKNCGNLPE